MRTCAKLRHVTTKSPEIAHATFWLSTHTFGEVAVIQKIQIFPESSVPRDLLAKTINTCVQGGLI